MICKPIDDAANAIRLRQMAKKIDMKKTVVIGASNNPGRYAYRATEMLQEYGHEVVPVGIKKGEVAGKSILHLKDCPEIEGVDTVTLYVGPQNQEAWYDYILGLNPKRIIFNPGTENMAFENRAQKQGIETIEGCTLVMLSTRQY